MPLNPKQAAFVREYLLDLNATQAAIRAGYSAKTAYSQGQRLLKHAEVAAAVAKAQRKRADKVEVTVERVLAEMATQAFFDPADLVDEPINGPEDIAKLPEQVRRAIVGWSWDRNGNFVLKLANKTAALDQLAKHLGLFVERHEHSGPNGGPIETKDMTAEAVKREVEELFGASADDQSGGDPLVH